jgi:cytochrome P450
MCSMRLQGDRLAGGEVLLADAFNPFDPDFMRDPGPVLEFARRNEPVFFSPIVGAWVLTRYDDVDWVLRDPEHFTSEKIISIADLLSPEVAEYFGERIPMEGTLIGVDAPEHTLLRVALQQAFTRMTIQSITPFVEETAARLAEQIALAGSADLVEEIAYPLPLATIGRLIGLPDEDVPAFRQATEDWSNLAVAYLQGMPLDEQLDLAGRILAVHERVLELFEQRRRQPTGDLLSCLVAQQEHQGLSDHQLLSLVPGLFLAGHETTANVLANGLWHLLRTRARWLELVEDPARSASVVSEVLRFDTSVLGMWRNVTSDCEIANIRIPAGQRLYLVFWSANRDETRFVGAADFVPDRASTPANLTFGRGIHRCIGEQLARLELTSALGALARSVPDLALADGFVPSFRPHFFLRGPESLLARCDGDLAETAAARVARAVGGSGERAADR